MKHLNQYNWCPGYKSKALLLDPPVQLLTLTKYNVEAITLIYPMLH
jgi:hypothetical protein